MPKKIAIIMPVYKNIARIEKAVDSVLAQDISLDYEFDLVIIEDGNEDMMMTTKIKSLVRKANRIRGALKVIYVSKARNDGPSIARSWGIASTTAQWISYLDVDDTLRSDYLTKLDRQINEFDPHVELIFWKYNLYGWPSYSSLGMIDPKANCGSLSPKEASQNIKISDSLGISHSRSLYTRIGGWPPFLLYGEDTVFCRRAIEASNKTTFMNEFSGTKLVFDGSQSYTKRRFDSGMYIMLDENNPKGKAGQYLDGEDPSQFFMDLDADNEAFSKRWQFVYTGKITYDR